MSSSADENYRLVIELCHLSRLPPAEMDRTTGQRREEEVDDATTVAESVHHHNPTSLFKEYFTKRKLLHGMN